MSRRAQKAEKPAEKPAKGCCVCGRAWTQPEFGWDCHLVGNEMPMTCSHECRARAGFKERLPV